MKYLLAIYSDETGEVPPDQMDPYMQQWFQFDADIRAAVEVLAGNALHPTEKAVTVRSQDDKVVTLDGPFAETKEQLGGFYLIDVDSLEEAIEWASRMPSVRTGGSVEIRPIQVFQE